MKLLQISAKPLQGVITPQDCCYTLQSLVLFLAVVSLLLLPDIQFYLCDKEKYIKKRKKNSLVTTFTIVQDIFR